MIPCFSDCPKKQRIKCCNEGGECLLPTPELRRKSWHRIGRTPHQQAGGLGMPLGEPFLPQRPEELILLELGIQKTSELPKIIPPLPTGDTKDLKIWQDYWKQHDAAIRKDEREKVLDTIGETRCKTCDINWQECNCPLRWKKELRKKEGE